MKVYVTHPNPEGRKKKLKREAHQRIFDTLLGVRTLEEVLIELLAKDLRPGEYRPGVGISEEQLLSARRAMQGANSAVFHGKKRQEILSHVAEFDHKNKELIKAEADKLKDNYGWEVDDDKKKPK